VASGLIFSGFSEGETMIALNQLKELAGVHGPCLTILLPLRDEFSGVARTDVRLTAAAQRADELLTEQGIHIAARERFLRPILKLAKNTDFSKHRGSLVIFRAPGLTSATFWPEILDTRVILRDEFFVLPFLRRLTAGDSFSVLALSIGNVRLLHGTQASLTRIDLPPTLPRNLMTAEGFATPEHGLAGRSAPGRNNGQSGAVHFGTSSLHDKQPAYLRDFFKKVERAIKPFLDAFGDPLIVAAVPREEAIYREVNTYAKLLPAAVHGSPDALPPPLLHEKALAVFQESQSAVDGRALAAIEEAAGRGLLEIEANAILEAAIAGQVQHLYLEPTAHADERLLNAAALQVLRNSGTVSCGDLPEGRTAAAILRYRTPALAGA
jgi:hypothetical protein